MKCILIVFLMVLSAPEAIADRRTSPADRLHADALAFRASLELIENLDARETDLVQRIGAEWWWSERLVFGASMSQSSPAEDSASSTSLSGPRIHAALHSRLFRPAADVLVGVGVDANAQVPLAIGDSFIHRPGVELGVPVLLRRRLADTWFRPRAAASAGDYRGDGRGLLFGLELGVQIHFSRLSIGARGSADRLINEDRNFLLTSGLAIAVEIKPGVTLSMHATARATRDPNGVTQEPRISGGFMLELVWYRSDRKNALRQRSDLDWLPCDPQIGYRNNDSVAPSRRQETATGRRRPPCQ